ncbi:MAG: 4-hydroxybutyrate dehydrogenase [Agathobaculum sp.]|jgi:4-hydroxybutyrate dehydrogenase|uniref:4-hydroxybutyrate dehydrogenase n=1 Tax=Agathobaculum sp. TaxID=2048138 RepID=UPI003D915730
MAMDAFSKSLMQDKREIVIAPTIYKFSNFGDFAEEFKLGERDVVLTNEFIYKPFMEELGLKSQFVFQEKFGAGEPSEAMIETMYEAIPYESYDRVIAVGGGAIMDLCKLLGCKRPASVHELYFKREPVVHEKEVIAIPTTCGTGSEVTNISVAIVKDEKDGKLTGGETKLGLVSDDIIPNKVCLIPDLLKTLPYRPFASSAIDALIHATESFLSPHRKTTTSEMFSVKAMEMILEGFRRIGENGPDARLDYLDEYVTASLYAGVAFLKAGCATVHGMSFPLGGTYHVPHGESNYALFGKILEIYDEKNPDGEIMRFKELIARITGCEVKDAIPYLNGLLEKVLPLKPLHEYGFKEEDIKGFAESVEANQQRLITNSYITPWTKDLSERVYRECF